MAKKRLFISELRVTATTIRRQLGNRLGPDTIVLTREPNLALGIGHVRICGPDLAGQPNQARLIEKENIKMKSNKMTEIAPMKQLKGYGLGRQGYKNKLMASPKLRGARPIEPRTLQMRKGMMGEKIKAQKSSLKGL